MSCYNQIFCVLLISLMFDTHPSYLRTKFISCSDLCICLPCAKILLTNIICFKRRTSHVIWWNCVNTIVCRERKYEGRNSKGYSDRSNRCCQGSKAQTLCSLNCSHCCPGSYKQIEHVCSLYVHDLSIFTTRSTVKTLEIWYIMWPFFVQYILNYNLYSLSIF